MTTATTYATSRASSSVLDVQWRGVFRHSPKSGGGFEVPDMWACRARVVRVGVWGYLVFGKN